MKNFDTKIIIRFVFTMIFQKKYQFFISILSISIYRSDIDMPESLCTNNPEMD
jgi:hypothetical protein